jgi:hypothetical protein
VKEFLRRRSIAATTYWSIINRLAQHQAIKYCLGKESFYEQRIQKH